MGREPVDVGAVADPQFGDQQPVRRHQRREPLGGRRDRPSSVFRSRLLMPIDRRAERDARGAPPPRHAPRPARPCRAAPPRRAPPAPRRRRAPRASTSTASAPCSRASATWRGSTMKSLARIGPSNAARTAAQIVERAAEIRRVGEHADRIGGAGISARLRAGSARGRIAPAEGEAFFTSMMKRAPGRASAARRLSAVGARARAVGAARRAAPPRRPACARRSRRARSAMADLDRAPRAACGRRARGKRRRAPAPTPCRRSSALPAVISSAPALSATASRLGLACHSPASSAFSRSAFSSGPPPLELGQRRRR